MKNDCLKLGEPTILTTSATEQQDARSWREQHAVTATNQTWPQWKLFGFRFAAIYLLLGWWTVYGFLQMVPLVGYRAGSYFDQVWMIPTRWVAIHALHLTGIASDFHPSDSRDTALAWTAAAICLSASLILALCWSVVDRARTNYKTASYWLRHVLRVALIFVMFRYAIIKIFPVQMPPPSLAVLNEPVGDLSPMTLLWTAIGLHPGFEMTAGWIECIAAFLLIFRRTALVGTVLTIIIMSNVVLYNIFFDVPVKLGALTVLITAIAILVPDLTTLWQFLIIHRPTRLTSEWVPTNVSRPVHIGLLCSELLLVAFALIQFIPPCASGYARMRASLRNPSPLTGIWRVDSALRMVNGSSKAAPILTGLGQPVTSLTLEPSGAAMARAADGSLWRAQIDSDRAKHTLTLDSGYFDGDRFSATYAIQPSRADQLILVPLGKAAETNGVLTLTRVPLPPAYPLIQQPSTWVNEWALER